MMEIIDSETGEFIGEFDPDDLGEYRNASCDHRGGGRSPAAPRSRSAIIRTAPTYVRRSQATRIPVAAAPDRNTPDYSQMIELVSGVIRTAATLYVTAKQLPSPPDDKGTPEERLQNNMRYTQAIAEDGLSRDRITAIANLAADGLEMATKLAAQAAA